MNVNLGYKVKQEKAEMAMYHSPEYQTSFESIRLLVQEKYKIVFQDGSCSIRLGFLIQRFYFSFFFYLHITPVSFMSTWLRGRRLK